MQLKRLAGTGLFVAATMTPAAALASFAPPASATVRMCTTMMEMTKTGVFAELISKTSFKMTSGMHSYVVKLGAMAHVTFNGKVTTLSKIKKGDTVKVTGALHMGHLIAVKVVASGM